MTDKKVRVCIVFGGKSGEHEVSLQSAKSVYEAIDKDKFDVTLVGIDKQGKWLLGNNSNYLLNATNPKLIALNTTSSKEITPTQLAGERGGSRIDVFFPLIHGTTGEDGALQGMFELLETAYVGAGVAGSAVGMDKDIMKRLLRDAGIPVAKFHVLTQPTDDKKELKKITDKLGLPIFVKPANMGSSVGISKAHTIDELEKAISDAFQYDTKVLCEEFLEGREVECSVLGNDNPRASVAGEIIPTHEFYSYEAKYIDENGAVLKIPAEISPEIMKQVQDLAIKAFATLNCSGMARVDFFLKKDGTLYVNEINTLPGFTKISMYPKLWEASGLSYKQLITELVNLAIEKHQQKRKLKRSFQV